MRPEEYAEAGRATEQAYRGLVAAELSSNEEYVRRVGDLAARGPHALILGAFEDGRALGTVTLEVDGRIPGGHPRPPLRPDQANVRMLGVRPDAQRQGVGRALMLAAVEEARRAGKRVVTLETTERMRAAQALYESMGFRRGPDQVFGDGFRLRTYELLVG